MQEKYTEYRYVGQKDYDKTIAVNGDVLDAYSKKQFKARHPEGVVLGETRESAKRNKEKDIGKIEVCDKRLYVRKNGDHNAVLFEQYRFVKVDGNGFIAFLRVRLLTVMLAVCFLLGAVGGVTTAILTGKDEPVDPLKNDPHITPIVTDLMTVSGRVTDGTKGVANATVTLYDGNTVVTQTTTDESGAYLFAKVVDGAYNLAVTVNGVTTWKAVFVNKLSVTENFVLTDGSVSSQVVISGENTPDVAVNGLDGVAQTHGETGKQVNVTLVAKSVAENLVTSQDKTLITAKSGETTLSYYDFSIYREILGVTDSKTDILETEQPLEIILPYDSSRDVGTYVFRVHGDEASKFTELTARPTGAYVDGTYYVTASYIFIYTKYFSTYAVGSASAGHVTKGSDTITYSDEAFINLTTGNIEMLYRHDNDSTNDVRLEIYLVGQNGNLLVSTSGIIPPGNQLTVMELLDNVSGLPSVGTYNGLLKVIILDTQGNSATNVDIPLSVAITR